MHHPYALLPELVCLAPTAIVRENRLYVEDGERLTSAGVTAGIDLMLAVIATEIGHAVVLAVARNLVVYLRRAGADPQLSPPVPALQRAHWDERDGLREPYANRVGAGTHHRIEIGYGERRRTYRLLLGAPVPAGVEPSARHAAGPRSNGPVNTLEDNLRLNIFGRGNISTGW